MPKPLKYSDSTPVDEPIPKGKIKAIEPGSGIKVAPEDDSIFDNALEKRLKEAGDRARDSSKSSAALKAASAMMRGSYEPRDETREPKSFISSIGRAGSAAMESKAKGGITASSRADGCCTKGKTRGKMY